MRGRAVSGPAPPPSAAVLLSLADLDGILPMPWREVEAEVGLMRRRVGRRWRWR